MKNVLSSKYFIFENNDFKEVDFLFTLHNNCQHYKKICFSNEEIMCFSYKTIDCLKMYGYRYHEHGIYYCLNNKVTYYWKDNELK